MQPYSAAMDTSISAEAIIMNKDYQIKLLEDRLAFALKQVEEKDKQIEQYKNIIKTMQDLLDVNRSAGQRTPNANLQKSPTPNPSLKSPTTPPGFQDRSIKGRKPHSFHVMENPHASSEEHSYYYRQMYGGNGNSVTINPISEVSTVEDDVVPEEFIMHQRHEQEDEAEIVITSPSQVLKKSRSHTSLAQISLANVKDESRMVRASTSSLPNLPKQSKSPNSQGRSDSTDWRKKAH